MTTKRLGIALMVWLIGVGMVGGGFYLSQSKKSSLLKPIAKEPVVDKSVVSEKPVVIPPEKLGKASVGTTHITQKVIEETNNAYSMTNAESVSNFMDSAEGKFLQMLFARLNSSEDARATQELTHLAESDLSTVIQISPKLQRMFYGYGPNDDAKQFLYDSNPIRNYRPHAALLHYIQIVRPDVTYQAQIRGSILPKVSNAIPTKIKVSFKNCDVVYLVRQSVGSCLIESVGPETKHFEVSFQLNIGIPHDVQTEGYPLLLWPNDLQITIKPIDLANWETEKKVYFVKG